MCWGRLGDWRLLIRELSCWLSDSVYFLRRLPAMAQTPSVFLLGRMQSCDWQQTCRCYFWHQKVSVSLRTQWCAILSNIDPRLTFFFFFFFWSICFVRYKSDLEPGEITFSPNCPLDVLKLALTHRLTWLSSSGRLICSQSTPKCPFSFPQSPSRVVCQVVNVLWLADLLLGSSQCKVWVFLFNYFFFGGCWRHT